MAIQASSRKSRAAAASVHKRCFSASALASIYGAFRCKHLHPGAVVIPAPVQAAAAAEFNVGEGSPPPASPLQDRFCGDGGGEAERKAAALARLQFLVRDLQSSDPEKRLAAASGVRGAARREGGARTTLAMMGAIPPLVAMLDPSAPASACAALLALLNLAVRNDENKAAIVRTGAGAKILRLLATTGGGDDVLQSAAAAALLTLTALDANKPAIGALPGAVPALSGIATRGSFAARRDALGALYNLSICSSNTLALVSGGAVAAVLSAVSSSEPPPLTRRAAATAFNLATTHLGRQALASTSSSSLAFVDLLASATSPSSPWSPCRGQQQQQQQQLAEQAAFVVMALAECSPAQRRAMSRGGATSSLLEAVLLGSPATQERAARALECLRIDDELMVLCDDSLPPQLDMDDQRRLELVSDERRAVDALVQQSLKMNMERIIRRASCERSSPQLVD